MVAEDVGAVESTSITGQTLGPDARLFPDGQGRARLGYCCCNREYWIGSGPGRSVEHSGFPAIAPIASSGVNFEFSP
jgi:hypothetical protein